jgi:hypothetical protein
MMLYMFGVKRVEKGSLELGKRGKYNQFSVV